MLFDRSIRFRLTLWFSAVLFGGQCLCGLSIWVLLSHSLSTDLDESLRRRTKGLERYLALEASDNLRNLPNEMDEFARSLPVDYVLFVQDADGRLLASSSNAEDVLPKSLPALVAGGNFGNAMVRGVPYRSYGELFPESNHVYRVVLAASASSIQTTLRQLAFLLLAAIPVVVIAAAAGGFWISKQALSPVDRMTSAASSIDFSNLSARLEVPRTSDEIQRLAITWNAMLQRIENSAIQINRFTADASHELRTPLSLIQATTDLALRRIRNPEQYRDALQVIRLESERMTRLVEDLLVLARTDADANPRHRSTFDLRVPLQAAALQLMPKAAARQVTLKLKDLEEVVLVSGDEDAVCRLILALLDNAVKHSPESHDVTVGLKREAQEAVLSVSDAGSGIPPLAKPHIFERFYRADPSRHTEVNGYGLGLAIAHAVAVQHGASIGVESEPGSTTFSIRFPLTLALGSGLNAA